MSEVIVFDKTLKERLEEYTNIFRMKRLTVSEIENVWSNVLEMEIDPNGWQAVWKIPRFTCERLNIGYPTMSLVYVRNTNFRKLHSYVKILIIENEDIIIDDEQCVPLIELFPTNIQAETVVLNIDKTANLLDMLRFFYTEILMPWERNDDKCKDWLNEHLNLRLRLYYDIKLDQMSDTAKEEIISLKYRAKCITEQQEFLQSKIDDDITHIEEGNLKDPNVKKLLELMVEITRIKSKFKFLENPSTRPTFKKNKKKQCNLKPTKYWLIFNNCITVEHTLMLLNHIKTWPDFNDKKVKLLSGLKTALRNCYENDLIILDNATFYMDGIGNLRTGGTIKGVYEESLTTLISTKNNVMFDLQGNVFLENLIIETADSLHAMLIKKGKVNVKNCTFKGNLDVSTQQGIVVLNGAELEMINCKISGFNMAIAASAGALVKLKNTVIDKCNVGLKIVDVRFCLMENCYFNYCKKYGVVVNNDRNGEEIVGSFDILNSLSNMQANAVTGSGNECDTIVNSNSRIKAIPELFLNPQLNATIS